MNKNNKHRKILALCICLLFIGSLLLSTAYIVKEANHNCIGDHCPICANVQMAEKAINELGSAFIAIIHLVFTLAILTFFLFHYISNEVLSTPITQNVRMNN